ncbi:MAG: hypothetical protein HYT47_00290 [Candidatus Vogelbacteria bacterium]|nr:hypothetical protein [Candidatus Vogelbacteria bacterium]
MWRLRQSLIDGDYIPDPYELFTISDPKPRRIHKASVRDRVLHQAVYRVLYQIFDPTFIFDSYSCRKRKGVHRAVYRLEKFARKTSQNYQTPIFVLQCDIRKFFDSVDQNVLMDLLRRRISFPKTLKLLEQIIGSFETAHGKGLPLGNVTSQIFANIYLNELDQFIKHQLKTKYYIRYCDDFLFVDQSPEVLGKLISPLRCFLNAQLKLDLHNNKITIRKFRQGIDYLGYVARPYYRVLRTRTRRRLLRQLGKGEIGERNPLSYLGLLSHCRSFRLKQQFRTWLCYHLIMPAAKTKTLVLLDVHAILHRAYHALPDFTTKSGEPTGGLYGLAAMLIKLIAELKPDYLAACYDRPEPTFRKAAYKEYKAGRKPVASDLVSQIERSRELFATLNVPVYEQAGFEADDIIGTIVEQTKKLKDLKIIIASGDLDTLQLVDGQRVTVYTFKKRLNETVIYDETATRARFGFGPERLADWKGLRGDPSDNIIGIAGIGEKTATTLVSQFGALETIYAKLKETPAVFRQAGIRERIIKLLLAGEEEAFFSKTLATIRRDAPITFSLPVETWRAGVKLAAAEQLFDQLSFRTLKERLKNLFNQTPGSTPAKAKASPVNGLALRELQIAAWLLNPEQSHFSWDEIAKHTGQSEPRAARVWLAEQLAREGLTRVYEEIELPLIPILEAAEKRGIKINIGYLQSLSVDVHKELRGLEKKIYRAARREFNLNSPKQLGQVLFNELGLPLKGLRKTVGGRRSTRESELNKLRGDYPIIADILAYRERQKLLSTYLDTLPTLADAAGAIHTTFDQTGTATGRLSSRDPNLQNIPAGAGWGGLVRRAFVARDGHCFVALDYSQIEMRVLAVLSGDDILLDLFRNNIDIHTGVAARVFNVDARAVTSEMRRQAKVINFGIIYGMGLNALKVNLNTTRPAAAEFYHRYFATFPQIRSYLDGVKAEASQRGYTVTQFGRRRYLPALGSPLPEVRAAAERMAMNAPLQGTAADIIKLAMIRVETELLNRGLRPLTHLLLTVHDELIYEVVETEVAAVTPVLKQAIEGVIDWPIPLSVKVSTGLNWAELGV